MNKHLMIDNLIDRYPELVAAKIDILAATEEIQSTFKKGGKLLVCGNGGSAADSDHIVGELMKSFRLHRKVDANFASNYRSANEEEPPSWLEGALPAISLSSHTALSTAFSNDESSIGVFAQQVYGFAQKNDLLLCISTSGNSANVVEAAKVAKGKQIKVVALTGLKDSALSSISDITIKAPQTETYKIQELHLPIYHAICAELEMLFFGEDQ